MEHWTKYSKDHYLFILNEAEKKLNETVNTMTSIQSRGRFLLVFALTSILSIIAWLISPEYMGQYLILCITLLILLSISVYFSIKGISKYRISVSGTSPKHLLKEELYSTFQVIEHSEKNLILNLITDYENRIASNQIINKERLNLTTWSFRSLIIIPLLFALVFLLQFYLE